MNRILCVAVFLFVVIIYCESNATCVTLTWTAPGNNVSFGQAKHYDILYSTSNINEHTWIYAMKDATTHYPKPAGFVEYATVAGLEPETIYYFAIKTADYAMNWSGLSNVLRIKTRADNCIGYTGNVDCSKDGHRSLSDITALINSVYNKVPLCCPMNANTDGSADGRINLSDITRLLDHVFLSKSETAACE